MKTPNPLRRLLPAWSLGLCLALPSSAAAQPNVAQGEAETAPTSTPAEALAGLRELVALDLLPAALERYGSSVATGGALARSGEARALMARVHAGVGDGARAAALLAPNALPSDLDADALRAVAVGRAWLAMHQDDLDRGLQELLTRSAGRTVPRYPDDPDALVLLARIFARRGDLGAAEAPAARLLQVDRLHPEAHTALHILGRAAVERGDHGAAQALFHRRDAARQWTELMKVRRLQARRAPEDPLPRLGLGLLWMEVEEWTRAVETLDAVVTRWPDQARAWFHLGECRRALGRTGPALEAYEQALRLDPEHLPARTNRALLWGSAGRADDALQELVDLAADPATNRPAFAGLHLALARLLLEREGAEAASAAYATYRQLGGTEPLELDPEDAPEGGR